MPTASGTIGRGAGETRRTALVTGASGGIGLELARLLAADGCELVLAARNRERLENVAADLRTRYHVTVRCEPVDLGQPGAARQLWTVLDEQDPQALDQMVQQNVAALTVLTRLVLPGMRQRRWGRILNVGSVVGYQPGAPRMAVYYATKAYVLSFSRGLARELHGTGVSVTVLSPGPTETAFDDRAGANVDVRYRRAPKMSAAVVARAGYDGILRQATEVVPGLMTKVMALAGELPPRRIALEVNRLLWSPLKTTGLP